LQCFIFLTSIFLHSFDFFAYGISILGLDKAFLKTAPERKITYFRYRTYNYFMKKISTLVTFVITGVIFFSCQKAFTNEQSLTSSGSLAKNAAGNCDPFSVNGIFKAGTALAVTNYIDVSVNVTTTGNYSISSDTLNGIFFNSSGDFTIIGLQVIRLAGHGTPVIAGTSAFTVRYNNSSSCAVQITVNTAGASAAAVFTLTGAPGGCTSPVVQGTYVVGIALNPSNKLTVGVNVTSNGDYTLSTAIINGISFSATGTFGTTGPQTVTLAGSGTPVAVGTNGMSISGTAASCSFPVTVTGTTTNTGNYLSRVYYIDTTLTAPFDTLARLFINYDVQNRVSTITEYDRKPNGDTSYYQVQTYFYTGNDTFAFKKIEYSREFSSTPPSVGGETVYYTFSNGRLVMDSSIYTPTNYSTRRVSYNGSNIQRNQVSYSAGTFSYNSSTIRQTLTNGNIIYQLDTLVSYINVSNPTTNLNQREEISVSYLSNPNPFYQVKKCTLESYYFDDISNSCVAAPKNLIAHSEDDMRSWHGTNPPSTTKHVIADYVYTFRPDGYPVEARVTVLNTVFPPAEKYKILFLYR
jgi:hypothetical protein